MPDYLMHHGIKGQKWGVRRFQNKDGSRTNAGKKHESENRAVLRGVRQAFEKSYSAYNETVKPGTPDSLLYDSPAREKAISLLQDDKNFQKAMAPIVSRAKDIQSKYSGKMSKDIDWNDYSKEVNDLDRAVGELCVKIGIVESKGPGSQAEYDRWSYVSFVAARELDKQTGDYGIGDALIHGGNLTMYPEQHNYLIHWLKKGEKAKYIDKVKLANGRWRYFYTQAEVDAYKRGLSKSAGSLADKAKQSARKSSGESLGSKASRALGKAKEAATDKAAEALVGAASRSKTVRNAVGGKHEEYSKQWGEMANASQRRAQAADRKAHEDSAAAARQDRKYGSGGDRYRESARINREEAESAASNASTLRSKAADERRQYENSLLGRAQARVNRKGKKKSSSKKKSNRLNLSGGNYAVFQDAKIGR